MNINRLKARSLRLLAESYSTEAEIAGWERRPEGVAHYLPLAARYRKLAAEYEQTAGKEEKLEGAK